MPREHTDFGIWTNHRAREAIERYEGLVRATARRLRYLASQGGALDEEDLRAEGRVAVLEALARYERYGMSEASWVANRVRQRIIDAIRRVDVRSRSEIRDMRKYLAGEAEGRQRRRGRAVAARHCISADSAIGSQDPLVERLRDSRTPPPDEQLELKRQRERLIAAIDGLPRRQRDALTMGLFAGLKLKEIGRRMGVSESRVCQLQKRAVHQLNRCLAA